MKKKMKRWLCFATILFITLTSVASNAAPSNDYTDTLEIDRKMSIINSMASISVAYKGNTDERGLITSLNINTRLALWMKFMVSTPLANFSVNEIRPYFLTYSSNINNFNDNFGEDGEGYISMKLVNWDINENNSREELNTIGDKAIDKIIEQGSAHVDQVYSNLLDSYNKQSSDSDKEEFLGQNSSLLKSLYLYSERVAQDYENIRQLCGTDSKVNGTMFTYNISKVTSFLTDSRFEPLVSYARSLIEKDILSNIKAKLNDGETAFQKLTEEQEYDGKKQNLINTVYWMMFSCSSTYRPFESTVGEDSFLYALGSLLGEENSVKDSANGTKVVLGECSQLYNDIKSKKKPLYKRELTSKGEGSGTAERITVREFLDLIEDRSSSGALVTVYGKFKRSEDTNTWSVFKNDSKQVYSEDGKSASSSNKDDSKDKDKDKDSKDEDKENKDNDKDKDTKDDSNNTSTGIKMEDVDGNEFFLDSKITNEDLLTKPVFTWGSKDRRAVVNRALLYNILKDDKSTEGLDNLDKRFLYINPLGDIVLDDDTVVVPGASNATYYSDKEGTVYNPNTAAFMNSYPAVSLTTSYFTVDDRQNGKFIMGVQTDSSEATDKVPLIGQLATGIIDAVSGGDEYAPKSVGQGTVGPTMESTNKTYCYLVGDNNETLQTLQAEDYSMPIELSLYEGEDTKIQTMRAKNYSFKTHLAGIGSGIRTAGIAMIVPDTSKLITYDTPTQIFPLNKTSDSGFNKRCETIAKRWFDTITTDEDGTRNNLTGRIDPIRLTAIFESADGGNSNIGAFVKDSIKSYESEDEGLITKTVKKWASTVLNTVGQTSGVIGLKGAYNDAIFGKFLYYANKLFPYILVCVILYFIVRLSRKSVNWIRGLYSTIVGVLITVLLVQVVPVNLPILLNGIINNVSDYLGYRSLYMKEEKYINPYEQPVEYDNNGNYSLGTSSINIYRFKESDIPSICVEESIDNRSLLSGKSYLLDNDSGLFISGDYLKMNIDRLFAGISITGGYDNNAISSNYECKSTKYVEDVMDYYTPYHFLIDGFIENLNKMSELYSVPPSQLHYSNGIYKDSFLVDCYLKSDLVLNGDNLDKLSDQFSSDLVDKAKYLYGDNNLDWLGLTNVLEKYVQDNISKVEETLWYKTMVKEGYFDEDNPGDLGDKDLVAKLIRDVNSSVKNFLLKNSGQLAYISDENLIKVTCLYELTEFNRIVSSPTRMLYPMSLNYEELKLDDVLLPTLTKDYDRYISVDANIVDYIASDYGVLGLVLFIIVIIQSFIIVNTMRFILPILYLLMLVCLLFRLAFRKQEKARVACKGFAKIGSIIFGCYALSIISTSCVYKVNSSVWCLIILVIVYSIFITLILTVLSCLILSPADFGSSKVNAKFEDLVRKIHLDNVFGNISRIVSKDSSNPLDTIGSSIDNYRRVKVSRSIDDDFDEYIVDNVMRSRASNYNTSSKPRKRNIIDRKFVKKRKNSKQYVIYEDEDDNDRFDEFS